MSWLVSGGDDGTIRVWDMDDGHQRLLRHGGRIRACSIAPDGTWFAGSGDDGVVRIWSPVDGALIAQLAGHAATVLACPVSPDGQLLAAITDKMIHIWNVAHAERVAAMRSGAAPSPGDVDPRRSGPLRRRRSWRLPI